MSLVDRVPYWLVSVSFPIERLADKETLTAKVEELAKSRGGELYMFSEPTEEMRGREGYRDFGCSVAFEHRDANLDSFVELVKREPNFDAEIGFDPEDVIYPEENSFSF